MSGTARLSGLDRAELEEEYERRGLAELSDAQLVGLAAQLLSVPLDSEVPAGSFVLHAPLELLARAGLLPQVDPRGRRAARLRLLSLVAGYEQAGPRLAPPAGPGELGLEDALSRLRRAIGGGALDEVDEVVPLIAAQASVDEVALALADDVLGALGAAGHANIYFDLARGPVAATSPALLWPLARELAKAPGRSMTEVLRVPAEGAALGVSDALARLQRIGPSGAFGIAAMVEHAEERGTIGHFLEQVGPAIVAAPRETGRQLLRRAAQMMLQGPPEQAPYGWTHCLTLSQAALAQAQRLADPSRAVAVAGAYVAAHWATLASEGFDPSWRPEPAPPGAGVHTLVEAPPAAAAALWWCPAEQLPELEQALVTRASLAHDAHHVKYSLACLRAAAADPPARRLFLAAAACLGAWWAANPDPSDPLAGAGLGVLVEA